MIFILVEKFDGIAHKIISLLHDYFKLLNRCKLFNVDDMNGNVGHSGDEVFYLLIHLVLCIQHLLDRQPELLQGFLHRTPSTYFHYTGQYSN